MPPRSSQLEVSNSVIRFLDWLEFEFDFKEGPCLVRDKVSDQGVRFWPFWRTLLD